MPAGIRCHRNPAVRNEERIISEENGRLDMDRDTRQAIAVWAVLVLPFLILGSSLYIRDRLTLEVIGTYWFPAIVLAVLGVVPPPWEPLVD